MSARHRGDFEYADRMCDDPQCIEPAVVDPDEKFDEVLCMYHLNEAYAMEHGDNMAKWVKENA